MRDLFLVYAPLDASLARGLGESFPGLELAEPVCLRPQGRILRLIGQGLSRARFALMLVRDEFLRLTYSPPRSANSRALNDIPAY